MRNSIIIIAVFWIAVAANNTYAQRSTFKGKKLPSQRSYNNPSLSRAKTGSSLPLFDEAGYPYQAIGIKIGDPVSLSFKFYFSERIALVADFGRTMSPLYKTPYADLFNDYVPDPSDTLSYDSHKADSDWAGELKFVYHINAARLSKGLRFYTGLGWQIRDTKLKFQYSTKEPAEPMTLTAMRRHQTQGFVTVLGGEFANFTIPVCLFFEGTVFYDLDRSPGWIRIQGGVRLRYVF